MSEVPVSLSTDLARSDLYLNQTCGNCKHLKRIAHPAYEKVCSEHGMELHSKPCERFSGDPTKINFVKEKHAHIAANFLVELSDDKLRLFLAIANGELRTRRYGFHIGMTVYLRVYGDDYLSNYRRMKVVSADNKYVNLVAPDGFTAMVLHRSVLKPEQWTRKKIWLERNERQVDPKLHKYTRVSTVEEIRFKKLQDKMEVSDLDATVNKSFAVTGGKMPLNKGFNERRRNLVDAMTISTRS